MPITINGSGTVTSISAGGLPDAIITQPELAANVAGNGPAFSAYATANTTISSATFTKVSFNTEVFDTNNNFDSTTNYRFTPTVAGYYQLNAAIYVYSSAPSSRSIRLYKNGSAYQIGSLFVSTPPAEIGLTYSGLVYFNGSTDYAEIYVFDNGVTPIIYGNSASSFVWFSGSMVRAA